MKPQFKDHQAHVHSIIKTAVSAVNPYTITEKAIPINNRAITISNTTFQLGQGRLFVVAVGKAAVPMATAVSDKLGDHIHAGIALTKIGQANTVPHPNIQTLFAAHPVPEQSSVDGGTAVFNLLQQTTVDDVVLFLISGGASALCTKPLIPLAEWQSLSQALLGSGCPIQAFNAVRTQLDVVKGGGLAQAALPARCVTLVLSDVIGNQVESIGSGPTVPSSTTAADALAVLDQYSIEHSAAREQLTQLVKEPAAKSFDVDFQIIGDVRVAAETAVQQATALGFDAMLLTTFLEGEASEAGKLAAGIAKTQPANRCIVLGGETTVTLRGDGVGGRNQELALAAAIHLANTPNAVVATYATDGDDGPTNAAGAIVSGETIAQAAQKQLSATAALAQNDSHTFFNALGNHLIITGQTGTNVNDLLLILTY